MRCFAAILEQRTAAPPWRANRLVAPLFAASVALLGCSAEGTTNLAAADSGAGPGAPASEAFACSDATHSEPEQLKRLTMTQYKNTIRDLTRWVLGDRVEADTMVTLAGLDNVPRDRREPDARDPHGSYRRLDQTVDQTHIDETFRVARTLASMLTKPGRLGRVAGSCATDADPENDAACFASFVQRFGERALRRPLDPDDEAFYRSVYGEDPTAGAAAYADVITVMLSAPEFLYFVEHGEAAVPGQRGRYQLSPFELASRLAYHFWQTLPDDALWQAARDRSLLEPAVLAAHVQRMLLDPRAKDTAAELFADWLKLEDLPALDAHVKDPLYAAFAGDDLPEADLRDHVIEDALDMLSYYTWTAPGGIEELLTSELSFARNEDLARIYGVARWDGNSPPPALPAGERRGMLGHAWFLAGASANTRPILRGVFVRRQLLCDDLPPPPANANAIPPELRSDRTTRQVVEELTQQPDTACAGCHATSINPLGFAFEGFDALGRQRAEQPLFSDRGEVVGALPVDTATVPRVTPLDESVSTGPADLMRLMLASGKLEACLARNYFRFTFGRDEDLARDGCALERLRARLVQSGRIRDMLAEAALLPELNQRRFEP